MNSEEFALMDQRMLVGDGGGPLGVSQELQDDGEEFGGAVDKKAVVLVRTMLERAVQDNVKVFTER